MSESNKNRCLSVLQWTTAFLTIFAINLKPKRDNRLNPWLIMYTVLLITNLVLFLPTFSMKSTTIQFGILALLVMDIVAHNFLEKAMRNLKPSLNAIYDLLDSDSKQEIKHVDAWLGKIILVAAIMQFSGFTVYCLLNRSSQFTPLVTWIQIDETQLSSVIADIMIYHLFGYFFMSSFIMCCFYVMTQFYLYQLSKFCVRQFEFKNQCLTRVRFLYQLHNKIKTEVNNSIGIIPLRVYLKTLIYFASTLSYVIIHENRFTIGFVIAFMGIKTINIIWYTLLLTHYCAMATTEFDLAREKATLLACSSKANYEDRHRLYVLISNQGTVQATALGLFEVRKQMLPNFLNAIITSTVMIVTSASQINLRS